MSETTYKPLEDGSDFSRVILKVGKGKTITPHCTLHGAMNKVSSFEGGGFWRCISAISDSKDNICRTGCIQR